MANNFWNNEVRELFEKLQPYKNRKDILIGFVTKTPYGVLLWHTQPRRQQFIYDAFWVWKKEMYRGRVQPGFCGEPGDHIHVVTSRIPQWIPIPRQYWEIKVFGYLKGVESGKG